MYACDGEWWDKYHGIEFEGEKWTQHIPSALKYGLNLIKGKESQGLGLDCIHFGGNSGYQAINLAYLFGAIRIYLLGYDMQRTGGSSHWHGNHEGKLHKTLPTLDWIQRFDCLAKDLKAQGVPVLNLTRETALQCFDRATVDILNDVLF